MQVLTPNYELDVAQNWLPNYHSNFLSREEGFLKFGRFVTLKRALNRLLLFFGKLFGKDKTTPFSCTFTSAIQPTTQTAVVCLRQRFSHQKRMIFLNQTAQKLDDIPRCLRSISMPQNCFAQIAPCPESRLNIPNSFVTKM